LVAFGIFSAEVIVACKRWAVERWKELVKQKLPVLRVGSLGPGECRLRWREYVDNRADFV
jgi:hypothetical protein